MVSDCAGSPRSEAHCDFTCASAEPLSLCEHVELRADGCRPVKRFSRSQHRLGRLFNTAHTLRVAAEENDKEMH